MRKPIQVYLDSEERNQLEVLKKAFECKTYSQAIKKVLQLVYNLKSKL